MNSANLLPKAAPVVQRSSLLLLAAELRDRIYGYLTLDPPNKILLTERNGLPHALARTCRQLREEFLRVYSNLDRGEAKSLSAVVKDFNFGPLMRYYHGLYRTIQSHINIILTTPDAQDDASFRHWLDYIGESDNCMPEWWAISCRVFFADDYQLRLGRVRIDQVLDNLGRKENMIRKLRVAIFVAYYAQTYVEAGANRFDGYDSMVTTRWERCKG